MRVYRSRRIRATTVGLVKGGAMAFAAWVMLGIIVGWIASNLCEESDSLELARAVRNAAVGAVLGGALASLLGIGSAAGFFNLGGWMAALSGAALMLAAISRRRPRRRSRVGR
jgi:uncharacterized membrane protein YeaQ/YmgE (transglycosylase-associated protein family)